MHQEAFDAPARPFLFEKGDVDAPDSAIKHRATISVPAWKNLEQLADVALVVTFSEG